MTLYEKSGDAISGTFAGGTAIVVQLAEVIEQLPDAVRDGLAAVSQAIVDGLAHLALSIDDPGAQMAATLAFALLVLAACRIVSRWAGDSRSPISPAQDSGWLRP